MAKISITDLKQSITTLNVPVKKTVIWNVEVTESNVASLKKLTKNSLLELGETVELEADIFVKKMNFKESREASKAIEWELNYENLEDSKVKKIDSTHMQAAQLLGSICSDQKGTPFFSSVNDIYKAEPSLINAMYAAADEVNNFLGKSRKKSLQTENSSLNSSSTESAETP
ncbi:phage tail assembly chaperone family protein, TAC [Acinetobacter baumannii]|uniref:phage tail assembly chaperone family protein, TAC n=1 Tax=Acinetobacter baumannii TaxID=470 RepID=UPI001F34C74B|nr:phage tail assembly chaperone family protein, TAC [Acinetobacter baumannii]UJW16388.1 phage tail assembly chaperone family protein, TAC [Acinetobacter baumannii]UQL89802.1 phage tail assembly chaperone family protein, TAC [Acinetobacter baumannii]HCW4563991.1 phage tail assembly chaperone family protein, TAC [Acinetobacter baumannii]HCW4568396.1 phage tail assembly chaperone family protein, TAC [Acinetobacter baumannii]HCW5304345.1 phage tail assembly chaperone family protein, TAC [Acinetob